MTESQPLAEHIKRRINLTEEEMFKFLSCFKLAKIRKRQFIIQPGFIAHHKNYVLKGAFRAYVVDEKGQDHTIQVSIEDWWITDYNSYLYQKPATMFVEALEESMILQLHYNDEAKLKQENHLFETFFRIMAERSMAHMQRRIITNLTKNAEERYKEYEAQYPEIVQRMPQYVLASYLGMSTEYLSRLRNKRTKKDEPV
jgi:CRP-like cAMP-binding protein